MNHFRALIFLTYFFSPGLSNADLIGHGGMIRDVDFSHDGRKVLAGSFDYSAILWDFENQEKIAVLDAHNGPVTSVGFIKENGAITTSDDTTAILWNLKEKEPVPGCILGLISLRSLCCILYLPVGNFMPPPANKLYLVFFSLLDELS